MNTKQPQPRRRWIRWFVLGPVILIGVVGVWGILDANGGVAASGMWNHRWVRAGGEQVGGYLVRPEEARRYVPQPATGTTIPAAASADGRRPAVLMLHEWWGLTMETAAMAEQLAADGYIVLAPDLLRGRRAVSVPGALVQMVLTSDEQVRGDVDRALREVRELPRVDPARVAVVGFCFGGTQAMHLGTRNADMGGTVILYGNGPITDEAQLGSLGSSGPVLGIYGAQDRTIPVDDVRRFEALLAEAQRRATISVYDDVGHAFVNPETIRDGGSAAEAWDEVRAFLAEEL
ncbi:MAG TPA: dienelactone hydrolase family protein [Alkalispirochaeta sp.]|nr:dienelactone hydrolase family protein [Alkalispirochaeta sp.]